MDINLDKLKDRIKEQRKLHDLTQEELGKIVQSSKQTVSHWEIGDRTPDIQTIITLSKIFNCSVSYLIGETDNPMTKLFKSNYNGNIIEIEVDKDNGLDLETTESLINEIKKNKTKSKILTEIKNNLKSEINESIDVAIDKVISNLIKGQ